VWEPLKGRISSAQPLPRVDSKESMDIDTRYMEECRSSDGLLWRWFSMQDEMRGGDSDIHGIVIDRLSTSAESSSAHRRTNWNGGMPALSPSHHSGFSESSAAR
jgi:hypothetical protein